MVIIINNILLYFYNLCNCKCLYYNNNYYYFVFNKFKYILREIKEFNIDLIKSIDGKYLFHEIVLNKYGNIVSISNDKKYVLLKISCTSNNRKIKFDDLILISKINKNILINKKRYYDIWLKKIDFLELYIKDNKISYYDFDYFFGLSEIAINLIKKIDLNNVKYGYSYNRFDEIDDLFKLLDPFNVSYIPIVIGFSECIKYSFFKKHEKVNYKDIFDLSLSSNDYLLFICRLLFPTYYFDLYKKNNIKNEYQNILNNIDDYIFYIKEIVYEVIERYNDLSFLNYIINQF